jgi:PAS domain S-box-containing protein
MTPDLIRIDGPLDPRMRQQEILAKLGGLVLHGPNPDGLLHEAARLVALGLRTGYCAILEHRAAGNRFLLRACVGWPEGVAQPTSLAAAQVATAAKALDEFGPIVSNSFAGDGRQPLARTLRLHGIVRAIDTAIASSDSVFGVLEAGSDTPGDFGPSDLGFIQAAANLIGLALERARTAAALVASWTRTHEILESISDIFFTLDHEFRFTHLNRKAEEWGGQQRDDLLGRVLWEAFPQLIGTETQAAIMRVARERQMAHFETMGPVRRRWVDVSVYPTDDGIAMYFRDIDERRRADMALRESEVRLRFAVESAGIGTWEQLIASGRVVRSAGHAAIFGVDPTTEWSHSIFLRYVVPEDRARADRLRSKAVETGTDWRIICRIRRGNDGALRWVEARGAPMPEPTGDVVRYVGIISDITERMEAESNHARQAEKLERRVTERTRELAEANANLTREISEREKAESALLQAQRLEAIGQLVGGVAHAFNNLLTATITNLELLGQQKLEDRARRLLNRSVRSAWRGSALTQQLLAYARQQNLRTVPVDTGDVLGGMRQLLAQTCGGHIRIQVETAGDLWPALGDPSQLRAVVMALVRNARDAMPDGGTLRIVACNIAEGDPQLPQELPAADYVQLSVLDTGTGMPEEVLAKAAEPFFTTKEIGKGHGLGLAQVDGVARQFGGVMRVRSTVGEGTTVDVFLPRSERPPAPGGRISGAGLPLASRAVAVEMHDPA